MPAFYLTSLCNAAAVGSSAGGTTTILQKRKQARVPGLLSNVFPLDFATF